MMHGFGLLISPNNDQYEGYFYKNEKHAYGKFTYSNGACYEGEFEYGKAHGHGVQTYQDGRNYDGPWKDGKKHGICFEQEDGQSFKVEYREGQHVRDIDPSNE